MSRRRVWLVAVALVALAAVLAGTTDFVLSYAPGIPAREAAQREAIVVADRVTGTEWGVVNTQLMLFPLPVWDCDHALATDGPNGKELAGCGTEWTACPVAGQLLGHHGILCPPPLAWAVTLRAEKQLSRRRLRVEVEVASGKVRRIGSA